jgi:CTP-dependent riboflavin kinase
MQDYFHLVAHSLTHDDFKVLAVLSDSEATAAFSAMKNAEVLSATQLSEATYRRIIYRLSGNKFIEIINQQKMHMLYITEYGINAIKTTLNGVGA